MTPKSSIERIYHGRFDYTPENYAVLRYVTYILGARYLTTVREEKGGTYYVGVHDEVSARPRGYCQLVVSFDTDPKLREMLLGEVQKGIERLAAEAPSEQEVNEAMLYFKKVNAERKVEEPEIHLLLARQDACGVFRRRRPGQGQRGAVHVRDTRRGALPGA